MPEANTMKLDTKISLTHLLVFAVSTIATIMIWSFTLKSQVDMNASNIEDLKKANERIENRVDQKLDNIQNDLTEIKLELKDKANRKDGN